MIKVFFVKDASLILNEEDAKMVGFKLDSGQNLGMEKDGYYFWFNADEEFNKKEFLKLLDIIADGPVRPLPQPRESKKTNLLDKDRKPFVKSEEELTRQYTLKEKSEIVLLVVLIIALVLIGASHIWNSRQKKEQQFKEKYKQAYNYIEKGDFLNEKKCKFFK